MWLFSEESFLVGPYLSMLLPPLLVEKLNLCHLLSNYLLIESSQFVLLSEWREYYGQNPSFGHTTNLLNFLLKKTRTEDFGILVWLDSLLFTERSLCKALKRISYQEEVTTFSFSNKDIQLSFGCSLGQGLASGLCLSWEKLTHTLCPSVELPLSPAELRGQFGKRVILSYFQLFLGIWF